MPLRCEVASVLNSLSTGNAVGPDGIPTEVLQNGGDRLADVIHKLIVAVWLTGVWSADWCEMIYVPILKKGIRKLSNALIDLPRE